MKTERFIAARIIRRGIKGYSMPVIRIAIVSVALGIAVMIISVAIVTGFQKQIREKISGFGSHIQIAKFDSNNTYEFEPISKNLVITPELKSIPGIKSIQVFGTKAGIIKTENQIQGIVLKGVSHDYDWSFFEDKLTKGKIASYTDTVANDSILISENLANLLHIKLNDELRMYFIINNQTRGRKFIVSGLYNTGLGEFDLKFIFGDLRHIQKLNGWQADQISGVDISIRNFNELEKVGKMVYNAIGFDLNTRSIKELHPQMFDWLDLQDMNVIIILVLMIVVSAMAMISTLLISILERTNMIGILKALGATNSSIRKIFIYNATYILSKGLLWGNMAGIGLCLMQMYFKIVKIPQESYFMTYVPINMSLLHILLINAGTLLLCTTMLLIPSYIVTRITPVKAIRFD